MRIYQRQVYHKLDSIFGVNYFYFISKICFFLSVPLRFINRKRKNGITELAYEVRSANYLANCTILSYLLKFPLFSNKYMEVTVQLELLRLSKNKNYKLLDGQIILENLKLKSKGINLTPQIINKYHYKHISTNFPFNS